MEREDYDVMSSGWGKGLGDDAILDKSSSWKGNRVKEAFLDVQRLRMGYGGWGRMRVGRGS